MSTMSMQPHLTFDDFLAMERKSELKHELIGGLVYNMADHRGKWATNNCGLGDQLLLPCPEIMLQINDIFA